MRDKGARIVAKDSMPGSVLTVARVTLYWQCPKDDSAIFYVLFIGYWLT
jgi:hypothetical protein